jgi:hypothetical protein
VVAGSGPEARRIREIAHSLGVSDRVEMRPWQSPEEIAALYRRAHVLLVPSTPTPTWAEQFGRVIVEAQASGVVIAGYATGAITEVAGDAGILVAPGAIMELGDRLGKLLNDPREFARRRAQGLEASRSRTESAGAAMHVAMYSRVLSGGFTQTVLPASPRARRDRARLEFGPTADTVTSKRPFALPILRRGGAVSKVSAWGIDESAELAARVAKRVSR